MMRSLILFGLALATFGTLRAEDNTEAKAIVEKAIAAHGGEGELKKLNSFSQKFKGTIQAQGMELPITGEIFAGGENRVRAEMEIEVANMKFSIISVVNKDKGWIKVGDNVKEMTKDQLAEAKEQSNVGAITTFLPLKDKMYTLSLVGEDKVGDNAVQVIQVARKDRQSVNLFFDKKTHLLLKTEGRVKDDATGQEVTEEKFFSDYNDKGLKQPKKIVIKRDGKAFMEAEMVELKLDEKFDDSTFQKP